MNDVATTHGLETRRAILRHIFAAEGCGELPDDLSRYLAGAVVTDSIREVEGLAIRIIAYASLTDSEITLDLAQHIVQKFNGQAEIITGSPVNGGQHDE